MSSGGSRPGAGRKKRYAEGYRPQLYSIEEELIARMPANKSEFVNAAIRLKLETDATRQATDSGQ